METSNLGRLSTEAVTAFEVSEPEIISGCDHGDVTGVWWKHGYLVNYKLLRCRLIFGDVPVLTAMKHKKSQL